VISRERGHVQDENERGKGGDGGEEDGGFGREGKGISLPLVLLINIHPIQPYTHSSTATTMADATEPTTEETRMREEDDVQEDDGMDAVSRA
jgi:hypothetical protein